MSFTFSQAAINNIKTKAMVEALRNAAIALQPTDHFAYVELNRMADELDNRNEGEN